MNFDINQTKPIYLLSSHLVYDVSDKVLLHRINDDSIFPSFLNILKFIKYIIIIIFLTKFPIYYPKIYIIYLVISRKSKFKIFFNVKITINDETTAIILLWIRQT